MVLGLRFGIRVNQIVELVPITILILYPILLKHHMRLQSGTFLGLSLKYLIIIQQRTLSRISERDRNACGIPELLWKVRILINWLGMIVLVFT